MCGKEIINKSEGNGDVERKPHKDDGPMYILIGGRK
jgi:hypothetical protein